MRVIYLCITYREILFSLADALHQDVEVSILFLEDESPVDEDMRQRLERYFPDVQFLYSSDDRLVEEFQNLPKIIPQIIRRNFRLPWGSPASWSPKILPNEEFDISYVYNTGVFTAKVVAGMSRLVVLREQGLNTYSSYHAGLFKALFRVLRGLSPFSQFLGEEHWVDQVEVSKPEDLSAKIRAKAKFHDPMMTLEGLRELDKLKFLSTFSPKLPDISNSIRSALLLTQPLEKIRICTESEKRDLYQDISNEMTACGYKVYVKNHPRETNYTLSGTEAITGNYPVEIWSLSKAKRFDIGVALCSASLKHTESPFCDRSIQLVSPKDFNANTAPLWRPSLLDNLRNNLSD